MRLSLLLCLLSLSVHAAVPAKAICWGGDSLTFGYPQNSNPAPARLADTMGVPVVNIGVGGDVLSSIYARWQQICQPFPYRVTVLEGGTNDLALGNSAASRWVTLQAWIDTAEAAGTVAVVVLVPPRWGSGGWTSDMETERLTLNASISSYAALHPAVKLVESDTVLGTGSPRALQVTYDYGDHVHLTSAGLQALADAVAAQL
jgi:lysophospholipase L1-like esterase